MKIGYSVQGSTDRAFLMGLQERWCPDAEVVQGPFRGVTGYSLRREYTKICDEFAFKSVDVMVFLTDADDKEWRQVKKNERSCFPQERLALAIHGVADRNIECWLCADPDYIAQRLGIPAEEVRVADPKGRFESAIGIDRSDRKEGEITDLVKEAPLRSWLRNPSFEDFYEQALKMSQLRGCKIENIRQTGTP